MAIADGDLTVYTTYSTKFHSIGGNATSSKIVWAEDRFRTTEQDEYIHNLFQMIWPGDIENTRSTYRCIAIKNGHGSETWYNVKAWVVNDDSVQEEVAITLAPADADPPEQMGSEYEAPANEIFVDTAVSRATAVELGNISNGSHAFLWIKRTPTANAKSRSFETLMIRIEGETVESATTYCGMTMLLLWHSLTIEIQECLERLNDIPEGRINLTGAQKLYDDSMYLVNRLSNPNVTDAIKNQIAQSRAMYLIYQEWTVELERAGGGLPPMVVSRVYELRRIANEMFNTITGATKRPDIQGMKGRSWRGRVY